MSTNFLEQVHPVIDNARLEFGNRTNKDPLAVLGGSYLLPRLPPLKNVPCLSGGMARAMLTPRHKLAENDRVCERWAGMFGVLCSLAIGGYIPWHRVGDLLDGTGARARWDLDGRNYGLQAALHELMIPTDKAVECFNAGVREGFLLRDWIDAQKKEAEA